jgi:16S rRNA (guanine(966)-N(2))-methyltransferase RsmD
VTGEVRIIGGQYKRSKLQVPNKPGLRPTPDRVRETLFNWLGQDLSGWYCFDAFAGTGALGIEAASRGASQVIMVERDAQLVTSLKASVARLKANAVEVIKGDGLAVLRQSPPCDLIFLDPPFAENLFEQAVKTASPVLKKNGFIYLEAPNTWAQDHWLTFGLRIQRQMKAGQVHAHLLSVA